MNRIILSLSLLVAFCGLISFSGCGEKNIEPDVDEYPFKQLSTIIHDSNIGLISTDSANAMASEIATVLVGRELDVTGSPFRVKYKSAKILQVTPNVASQLVAIKLMFIPEEGYVYNLEEEHGRMPLGCKYTGNNGETLPLRKEVLSLDGHDLLMYIRVTSDSLWCEVKGLQLVSADGVHNVSVRRADLPSGYWYFETPVEGYAEITANLYPANAIGQCPSMPNRHSNGYISFTDEYYESTVEYNLICADEERDGGIVYNVEYDSAPGVTDYGKVLLTIEKDGDSEHLSVKALDDKAKAMPLDGLRFQKM